MPDDGGRTCIRCDQLNDLLSLVIDLKEEVERLRTIKDCEREIDWWCQSLSRDSLARAWVRDISRKLPGLIRPSDYYPLLIIQAGRDEIAEKSLRSIKKDFRRLGQVVDGAGVQVVFSSITSVAGKGTERIQKTHLLNKWLRGWCKHRNFVFFDHRAIYSAPGMMAADGSSLSLRGKRILAEELAGLAERSLN